MLVRAAKMTISIREARLKNFLSGETDSCRMLQKNTIHTAVNKISTLKMVWYGSVGGKPEPESIIAAISPR